MGKIGTRPYPDKLAFIADRCSAGRFLTQYWLSIPEFQNAMFDEIVRGAIINDECILKVMEELFVDLQCMNNFNARLAERAIRKIRKELSEKQAV